MALEEVYKLAFNAVSAVQVTFASRCASYEIRSDDGDYYVAEDETATMGSFRIPKDHTSERLIPCNYLSVLGVSGNGLCEIKTIPLHSGITDAAAIASCVPRR